MKNLALKTIVKLQDRKMRRQIQRDEEGLTMLAYALGAAVIIVPLALAVLAFGNSAVTDAGTIVDGALAS
jgi:Flp pilus assembly pilin Flp